MVETGYENTLEKLKVYMEKKLSHRHYSYKDTTKYGDGIKFSYKGLDVDLLLSPYWETRGEYYHDIEPLYKRRM